MVYEMCKKETLKYTVDELKERMRHLSFDEFMIIFTYIDIIGEEDYILNTENKPYAELKPLVYAEFRRRNKYFCDILDSLVDTVNIRHRVLYGYSMDIAEYHMPVKEKYKDFGNMVISMLNPIRYRKEDAVHMLNNVMWCMYVMDNAVLYIRELPKIICTLITDDIDGIERLIIESIRDCDFTKLFEIVKEKMGR